MDHSISQRRLPFASWQTKPREGEPAHGYFALLVGEGYQASARVHANEMEINGRNIVLKEILGELLLLPLPEDRKQSLSRWTPIWNGKYHCLSGETLRKRQMSFYNRRFCRGCLAEDAHYRAWWDIIDFHICPFHGTVIEQETSAGDRIKWWHPSLDSAPDGEYLARRLPRVEDSRGFEWYILSRLGFVTADQCCPALDSAPLHEVIDACAMVGRLVSNPWRLNTPQSTSADCRKGFEVLRGSTTDVEAAFVRWLDEHVAEKDRNRGVQYAYGWFRRRALWDDVDIASRRAFASVGRIGRQGLKIDLPHREFTIKEAAAMFGADVRGLRKIAQQAGLVPKDPSAASRAFLSRERMEELHAIARDLISVKEAATRLGCSQECLRALVKRGALKGFNQTRLFGAKGHGLALRGSEINVFAERIRDVACVDGIGQVHRIGYLSRRIQKTDAEIVQAVLAGEISVCRIDRRRKGISGWQFEATAHKKPFRRQVTGDEIRKIEAAELLGYQPETVTILVEANLIKTREGKDGRVYLDRESFEAFHGKYVNAKLYLDRLRCREDQLETRLQELRIRRRHARLPTRNNVYIVERKSIERAIGPLASGGDDPLIWHQFRKELASVCPSFVLPASMGGRDVKAYTATRATYVELMRDGQDLIVRKTFRKAAHREWAVFLANQWLIREEWSAFTWSKKNARGSVTAEFRISTDWDIDAATVALRSLYMHFKNPRKLPKR